MKTSRLLLATTLALSISLSVLLTASTVDMAYATVKRIYDAPLSGQNEVPAVQTNATGLAEFTPIVNDTIKYRINITGIFAPTAAHFHNAKAGENGEVVADLMTASTKNNDVSYGYTIRGNLSDSSLKGPMQGKTLADLVAAMESGDIYVNIHTDAHPDGEIRGQIFNTQKAPVSGNSTVG
jgi:hypothetical protein